MLVASSLPLSPPPLAPSSSSPPRQINREQWTNLLRTQARNTSLLSSEQALTTYISMTSSGILPDHFAFPAALKAATSLRDIRTGKQIHAAAIKLGYHTFPTTVSNTLITFYARCGQIASALKVFDGIPVRDHVTWNSIIAAYCLFEEWELALDVFRNIAGDQVANGSAEISSFTMVSAATACSNIESSVGLMAGKELHGYGLKLGFYAEEEEGGRMFSKNSLISMYAKLGEIDLALKVFDRFVPISRRELVSWNTIISSFTQNSRFSSAVYYFKQMLTVTEMIKPDGVTLCSVLPACSHLDLLKLGIEIHAYSFRNGNLFQNSFVRSALVDLYSNAGRIDSASRIFTQEQIGEPPRLGLWNAMISGYAQNGLDEEALRIFIEMEEIARIQPNTTTVSSVLPACARSQSFRDKEAVHGYVLKRGFGDDPYVQNALMDMYGRMDKFEIAAAIFDSMVIRDVVSWNTMISSCILCNLYLGAFDLMAKMNCKPNSITVITVLPACGILAALSKGKEIHSFVIRNQLESDVAVGSALVDAYAKSGCIDYAQRVFDGMSTRNVVTWNVLIMAYGMHGRGREAVRLFRDMMKTTTKPNEVTFIVVFAACSHSGIVEEGLEIFHSLKSDHTFEPTSDHYACMVDLLGRSGDLSKAYSLITNTMNPDLDKAGAWSSLLGACAIHRMNPNSTSLAEIAANHLFELEPTVASHYVVLSNIYSSAGMWLKAAQLRQTMKSKGVKKPPGCSWIESESKVHEFLSGDTTHPESAKLRKFIKNELYPRMKAEGFVADLDCVLHNVGDDEKEVLLCGHSEKLAIAYGLLNGPVGSVIRVAKNLRICNDCHNTAKFVSKMCGREIIVRDVRRFHQFIDGSCSCRDYW